MSSEPEYTWRKAIEIVLRDARSPMHTDEIVAEIIDRELRNSLGATPAATVGAHLYGSLKREGNDSPFEKVDKAIFRWRGSKQDRLSPSTYAQGADTEETETDEPSSSIVTCFGMFWQRNKIEWKSRPLIQGLQQLGAETVDFCDQLGIYVLYDGREAIYVGRSTDRPLGKRLYEHTRDRLASRWDRFSWFGLRPVNEDGSLSDLPQSYSSESLLPALEALLIEAVELRQNRRRGDDLGSVEYLQMVDESISRATALQTVVSALQQ